MVKNKEMVEATAPIKENESKVSDSDQARLDDWFDLHRMEIIIECAKIEKLQPYEFFIKVQEILSNPTDEICRVAELIRSIAIKILNGELPKTTIQ